jgi:hypothetical protein
MREEELEGLVAKWRESDGVSVDPARGMTYRYCADELEVALTRGEVSQDEAMKQADKDWRDGEAHGRE